MRKDKLLKMKHNPLFSDNVLSGEFISEDSLINSIIAILPKGKIHKILDPCCGSGKLINAVSKHVSSEQSTGLDIMPHIIEHASSAYSGIEFLCQDSTYELDFPSDFDLVIGALPIGVRCERRDIAPHISTTNTSDIILYRSLLKLKPGGIGIFLAAQNLLFGRTSKMMTKYLSELGINPIGLLYVENPLGRRSGIPGIITIFQRDGIDTSVIGKAPSGSESFLPDLCNMIYNSGPEIEGYRRSIFGNVSSFTSDGEPIFTDNFSNIQSLKIKLNDIGVNIYEFDDVVLSYTHTKPPNYDRLQHRENSIYLPKARGVTEINQDDLSPRLKNYYQLELDPLIANNLYFMDTMNSNLGKEIFDICATGHTIPQISKSGLKKILFPLPSIEEQEEWADVSLEIKEKEGELVMLKQLLQERSNIDQIKDLLDTGKEGIERTLEQLLAHNEDNMLEFKASMWTKYKTVNKIATEEIVDTGGKAYFLQDEILHTVAAFLNTEGGTLLIGVKDKPLSWGNKPAEVFGIEADYKWLGKNNQDGDGYVLAVYQVLNNGFGETATAAEFVNVKIVKFNDKEICRVDVKPLPRIMNGELYIKEKTSAKGEEAFYYRVGPSSQKASIQSAARYIRDNFPGHGPSNN